VGEPESRLDPLAPTSIERKRLIRDMHQDDKNDKHMHPRFGSQM
jgi:hypothetical protein